MGSRNPGKGLYDLVVVGGGPAGISAAVQAAKLGLKAILVEKDKPGGTIQLARKIENLPPWPPASGPILAGMFADRLLRAGIPFLKGEVLKICPGRGQKALFQVRLKNKELISRALILATGQRFCLPDELRFLDGKALFPGQVEPALLNPGTRVGIIGGSEVALDQALYFTDHGAWVFLLTRSVLRASASLKEEFTLRRIPVERLNKLVGVKELESGLLRLSWLSHENKVKSKDFHFLLAATGKKPAIPEIEGCSAAGLFEAGFGQNGETKLQGLYVAGDLKNGKDRYVSLAVADGLRAALKANEYLSKKVRDRGGF
jgi:thioredoxin reductase (NADPH)